MVLQWRSFIEFVAQYDGKRQVTISGADESVAVSVRRTSFRFIISS